MLGLSVWLNEPDSLEGRIVGVTSLTECDSSVEGDEFLSSRDGAAVGFSCVGLLMVGSDDGEDDFVVIVGSPVGRIVASAEGDDVLPNRDGLVVGLASIG